MSFYHFTFDHVAMILLIIAQGFLYKCIKRFQSVAGISGKSQILFASTILIRCFMSAQFYRMYDTLFFVFNLTSLILTLIVLLSVYKTYNTTYEMQYDKFNIMRLVIPVLLLGAFVNHSDPSYIVSYLEVTAIVPQLYFFYKSKNVEKFMYYYIVLLVFYKFFNVVAYYQVRYYNRNIDLLCSLMQIIIYCDFLFYYRIKKFIKNENKMDNKMFNDNMKEVVLTPNSLMQKNEKNNDVFVVPVHGEENKEKTNIDIPEKY